MKLQPLLIALTVANSALLITSLVRPQPVAASPVVPVLRGRALEIVDDQGRVRSSITVGTGTPDTVLFRLISEKGQPNVKIESINAGSAMDLVDASNRGIVFLEARGPKANLTVTDQNGPHQLIQH